jgi:hypothetical protein
MAASPSPSPILIYLAGPIDDIEQEDARGWREEVGEQGEFVCFFSPAHAYIGVGKHTISVADFVNRHVIDFSHGVLANFEEGAGFGTIREIDHARRSNTPVVVVDLHGRFARSLMTFDLDVVEDLDEGLQLLLTKIADMRNEPPTIFGFPVTQLRPVDPEGGDE